MSKLSKKCQLKGCNNIMLVPKSLLKRKKFCCKEHAHLSYRKGIELTCMWCNEKFYRSPSTITNGRGKFCSFKCRSSYYGEKRKKQVEVVCSYEPCSEKFEILEWYVRNGGGKYCSVDCYYLHKATLRQIIPEPLEIKWNSNILWLVGLITADGCLVKDRKAIIINSKDKQLLEQVEEIVRNEITGREYKISHRKKDNHSWWSYYFESPKFYDLLLSIGLMPNKSLVLMDIKIPDEFFSHFLRGVIDGDGCIKRRTVNNKEYLRIRIGSASEIFIKWLQKMCAKHIQINGGGLYSYKNRPFWELSYSHYDSLKIANFIYKEANYYLAYKKEECEKYLNN